VKYDRPRRPVPLTRDDDIDHTTVRTLRFPNVQGYARRPMPGTAPVEDTRAPGPSPERVNRFNDYPGE
jgi:hypothetical protein